MKPLISVIVPIYNVEKHLEKCVRSLMNQTYENIEIIAVDDGSPDKSGELCDCLAKEDGRIKVIHKENGGVASARNAGLEVFSGEYFCFVDGDDWVRKDYIAQLYELISEKNADISMCAYVFAWDDGSVKRTRNGEYPDDYVFSHSGKDALKKMLYTQIYAPSCWAKLYKKEFAFQRFQSYAIGEDLLFVSNLLLKSENVVMINEPMYYYYQNKKGVIHSVNPDKIYDAVVTGDELFKLIPENETAIKGGASFYVSEKNIKTFMQLYKKPGQETRIKHIWENIKNVRSCVIKDGNALKIARLNCLMTYLGKDLFYIVKTLRNKI